MDLSYYDYTTFSGFVNQKQDGDLTAVIGTAISKRRNTYYR